MCAVEGERERWPSRKHSPKGALTDNSIQRNEENTLNGNQSDGEQRKVRARKMERSGVQTGWEWEKKTWRKIKQALQRCEDKEGRRIEDLATV